MGEFLVIRAGLLSAAEMLKILGDPRKLYWEESPHNLDLMARWLPKKGFKILPKIFDPDYRPGMVEDEGDKLVKSVHGCSVRVEDGVARPVWHSDILELPEMREELRRIIEEDVLDMSFEEELAKDLEETFGKGNYEIDEQSLKDENENLRDFAKIMMKLIECIDQVKADLKKRGEMPYVNFEFYIPR